MNKFTFSILLVVTIFPVILSFPETKISLSSTSSYEGMFIRKISESSVIFSNKNQEINYSPETNSINKYYRNVSICARGTMCPLLMFNGNTPSYMISKNKGNVQIVDLSNESVNKELDFSLDVRSMSQYDSERIVVAGDDSFAAKKSIHIVNVRTREKIRYFHYETNDIESLVLKDGQIMAFRYYKFVLTVYCTAFFLNTNGDIIKEVDITKIGEGIGYYKTLELSNKRLISCFLIDDETQIRCFSGTYGTNTYSMSTSPKIALSNCSKTKEQSFSFYLLNNEKAIISCGGAALKLQFIDYSINTLLSSDLVVSGNYAGVEFLVLSEYKLLFTMAKYENSSYNYYKHLYYFPYCVSNSIIINNGEQYPIQNIFNSNLSKNELTEHTLRILFVTLPNIGAILNGSSSISSGNIYAITSLKYSSNLSGATSFRYKGVENSAFSQTFYSNECTLNIIVCYESCKTCSTSGTSSKHNCNLCDNDKGFYREDGPGGNCIKGKDNYYLDDSGSEKTFKPCSNTCSSCSKGATSEMHNCDTCANDFVFIQTSPSNCIEKFPKPNGYYLGKNSTYLNAETYYPCNTSNCKDCDGPYNENHEDKCLVCMDNYAFFEKYEGECTEKSTIPENTYFDEESQTYRFCYNSCSLCETGGNENKHNCTKCMIGYSFISILDTNCINKEEKEENFPNYYLDIEDNTYKQCHSNCKLCSIGENETDNNCDACIDGFSYLEEDIQTKNCYDRNTTMKPNYYLDETMNTMRPCYSLCSTCNYGGIDTSNNCTTCIDKHFFMEHTSNCFTKETIPKNYYFDSEDNKFKKCFDNCGECTIGGNETIHNCDKCKSVEYSFIEEPKNNCILKTDKPSNYYYDEQDDTFRKCFELCSECREGGNKQDHHCTQCIDGYSFSIDKESNCIVQGTQKSNYYLDKETNTYRLCYSSCSRCEYGGIENNHNCTVCTKNLEWTSGNNLGNCLNLSIIDDNITEISQFLPLLTPLKSDYDIKILEVTNKSKFYYYSTKTIFTVATSNFTYVYLNECEDKLKKKYNLNSNEKLYIGELLYNNDPLRMNYKVYSSQGKELDLGICNDTVAENYFPMIKSNNESSLANKVISFYSRQSGKEVDIYDASSDFYTDICADYNLDDQDLTLAMRQEMYNSELNQCPKDCKYRNYNPIKKVIECDCDFNRNGNETESSTPLFNVSEVHQDSFNLFKCFNLLASFPSFNKTYLHWFGITNVGSLVACSVIFFLNSKGLAPALFEILKGKLPANPTKKKKKPDEEEDEDKDANFIEMSDIKSPNTQNINNSNDISPSINGINQSTRPSTTSISIFGKEMMYEDIKDVKPNEIFTVEELNLMSFLECRKYDKRTVKEYFKDVIKQKILFISCFTFQNFFYPVVYKVSIHFFVLSLFLFFNSVLYVNDPLSLSLDLSESLIISLYSSLASFCIFNIFDIIMSSYGVTVNMFRERLVNKKQLKKEIVKIVRNVKIKGIIVISIMFALNLCVWYYLFVFGIIKRSNQKNILVMTIFSLIEFIFLQFALTMAAAAIRVSSSCCKSNLVHMISKCFYYLI